MEFVKESTSLPVEKLDNSIPRLNLNKCKRHGELLPNTIRVIFAGPSNCRKINPLFTVLLNSNRLHFENV